MNIVMLGISGIGIVLIILGLAFVFPYKAVSRLSAVTEGIIKDMTYDAMSYNQRVAEKLKGSEKERTKEKMYITMGVGEHHGISGESKKMYHAVYFYTVNGIEYSRAEGLGYNKGIVEKNLGNQVAVHYNPENPLNASLSSGMVYRVLSSTFILIGIILMLAGILLL